MSIASSFAEAVFRGDQSLIHGTCHSQFPPLLARPAHRRRLLALISVAVLYHSLCAIYDICEGQGLDRDMGAGGLKSPHTAVHSTRRPANPSVGLHRAPIQRKSADRAQRWTVIGM